MFSNLSQGSLVYVLSLGDELKYNTGIIESITYSNNQFSLNPMQGRFVDMNVNINGKTTEVKGIPANSSISSNNSYIITDSKDGMINQIETLSQNSRSIIENIDHHKKIIKDCDNILSKINPSFAKESERDKAILVLNNRMDGLAGKIDEVLKMLIKEE